jgi:hypothetical protein
VLLLSIKIRKMLVLSDCQQRAMPTVYDFLFWCCVDVVLVELFWLCVVIIESHNAFHTRLNLSDSATILTRVTTPERSRDNAVGIATGYGLDD